LTALRQHPDERERPHLWAPPELADPIGPLKVGEHQNVEEFGASQRVNGPEIGPRGSSRRSDPPANVLGGKDLCRQVQSCAHDESVHVCAPPDRPDRVMGKVGSRVMSVAGIDSHQGHVGGGQWSTTRGGNRSNGDREDVSGPPHTDWMGGGDTSGRT
jgi:hypothetical protein